MSRPVGGRVCAPTRRLSYNDFSMLAVARRLQLSCYMMNKLSYVGLLLVAACGETGAIVDASPADPYGDAALQLNDEGPQVGAALVADAGLWPEQAADDFRTVRYVGDRIVVVLDALENAIEDTQGRVQTMDEQSSLVVTKRNVAARAIDVDTQAWLSAGADLYSADGKVCHAAVARISAMGFLHVATDDEATLRSSGERWKTTARQGGVYLVAEIGSDCPAGAVWARQGSVAATPAWPSEAASPELEALAIAAVPSLSLAQDAMAEFRTYEEAKDPTRHWDSEAYTTVKQFVVGPHRYVRLTLSVPGGCGDWGTQLSAVWEVESSAGHDQLVLRQQSVDTSEMLFATDLNSDGVPELIAPDTFEAPWSSVGDEGCGC